MKSQSSMRRGAYAVIASAAMAKPKVKRRPVAKTKAKGKVRPAAKPKAKKVKAKVKAWTARPPTPEQLERAAGVRDRLSMTMPEPKCELDHVDAWTLLVATILSAQSTDKMVNTVTPVLFRRWPTPADLAAAKQDAVESVVKSTGFFRNKAKSIREASRLVTEKFGGTVPKTVDEMLELPGVARKTANVVLGTAYRVSSGITVDTHAGRVARRLRLTKQEDPVRVELDLCGVFPQDSWIDMGHRFVLHGRYVCLARAPRCKACPINELCPSRQAEPEGTWQERAAQESHLVETRGVRES